MIVNRYGPYRRLEPPTAAHRVEWPEDLSDDFGAYGVTELGGLCTLCLERVAECECHERGQE